MNTAVVNVKVDPKLKRRAQKVAEDLGFSLSALINAYLKQLTKTKTITFSTLEEEPSDYFIKSLKESEADVKAGRVISFKDSKQALAFLDKMIGDERKSKN